MLLLKSTEDKCSIWKNKIKEQGLESNAAEKEVCSFLTGLLTKIDSKVLDPKGADNNKDKKLTEAEGGKEVGMEAKKEAKKKMKG